MEHDAWFFIGIFAFIFLIWAATGGPTHPLSFAGPFLAQPAELGGGKYLSLPRSPFSIGNSNTVLSNSNSGSSYNSNNTSNQSGQTLSGVAFGPPSVYEGTLELSHYVSGAGGDPNDEYVEVSLSSSAQQPVTLSGFTIQSEATGNGATIPLGTEVPMSGTIQALQQVVLQPGDTAIITSGRSPIGASFRENKCIGYFSQFQTFSPSLNDSCPDPLTELQQYAGANYIRDNACITYVQSLSRCTISITPPLGVSSVCQSFLNDRLNYNGCVAAHEGDSDFKENTWRIYLGSNVALWRRQNEVIKLIDPSGKTVDAFSY